MDNNNIMDNQVVAILLAIFLPPIAVYLLTKEFGKDLIINIILCFIGGIPGIAHALWMIFKK